MSTGSPSSEEHWPYPPAGLAPAGPVARSPFVRELGEQAPWRTDDPASESFFGDTVKRLLCPVFLPKVVSADYEKFLTPPTTGRMTFFVNGRTWAGAQPMKDHFGAFDAMQAEVEKLQRGDRLFLAAWMFEPAVALTRTGPPGITTWGQLFQAKAREGVTIRIIMNDFDPIAIGLHSMVHGTFIPDLDKLIDKLPAAARDDLKYIVSRHPAVHHKHVAGPLTLKFHTGSHHEKFMLLKTRNGNIGFCGGLDIAFKRTPAYWGPMRPANYRWLWHDIHARVDGLVTRDLEREFVMRWNREKGHSVTAARPGWKPHETLALAKTSAADRSAARNDQQIQTWRTVSVAGTPLHTNRRDDIFQGYLRLIGCAFRFLYMENQYFREPKMADAIVQQAKARQDLVVIVVVPSETDDDPDLVTKHGNALQHEFFRRLVAGVPANRLRIYTMVQRIIHSKFLMADDRALTVGSANANPRGFQLDTELNFVLLDTEAVPAWRHRLWAHNLGLAEATVAGWPHASFLKEWDAVAKANAALRATPVKMAGEAIVPWDPLRNPGVRDADVLDVETETRQH